MKVNSNRYMKVNQHQPEPPSTTNHNHNHKPIETLRPEGSLGGDKASMLMTESAALRNVYTPCRGILLDPHDTGTIRLVPPAKMHTRGYPTTTTTNHQPSKTLRPEGSLGGDKASMLITESAALRNVYTPCRGILLDPHDTGTIRLVPPD